MSKYITFEVHSTYEITHTMYTQTSRERNDRYTHTQSNNNKFNICTINRKCIRFDSVCFTLVKIHFHRKSRNPVRLSSVPYMSINLHAVLSSDDKTFLCKDNSNSVKLSCDNCNNVQLSCCTCANVHNWRRIIFLCKMRLVY